MAEFNMPSAHKAPQNTNGREVEVLEVQPCNDKTIICSRSLIDIKQTLPNLVKRSIVQRMKEPDMTTNPYDSEFSDDEASEDAKLEQLESFIYDAFSLKLSNAYH